MKTSIYSSLTACLLIAVLAQSCSIDEPFGSDGEGELRVQMVINSDVTRAEMDEDALKASCVLYISSEKGLIHKYKGLGNVPESLMLKNGHYVAEAWAGDSVPASFDSKFYSAYQPFDINSGINSVAVTCKIANVVVSVNPNTIDPELMKDWNINVKHSRAGLDFNAENMDYAKGYFMMPNADKELVYTITGTNSDGNAFTHTGKIENPQKAHEYVLNVEYNPEYEELGGSFVTITIDDTEILVEDEVTLLSRPAIKGVGFNIDSQITGNPGEFTDRQIKVTAFGDIRELHLMSSETDAFQVFNGDTDLINMTPSVASEIGEAGITWDKKTNEERNLATSYLTFGAKFFNALPERDTEYIFTLRAVDGYGKYTDQNVRIAVGENAIVIDDPIVLDELDQTQNLMAVLSRRATLSGMIVDGTAANPGIRYRESGTTEWTFQAVPAAAARRQAARRLTPAQATRVSGTPFSITLTGLKPGTRYEYQAVAGDFAGESKYFTTEGTYTIPNASFETWGTYSAKTLLGTKTVIFPGTDRNDYFWDSGNEGAATANKTVLNQTSDMVNSGSLAAKLASTSAAGVIAAGNVFAGIYVKTDGTDGVLSLGRTYDGSHPDKIAVYASYAPGGSVAIKKGNEGYVEITTGGTDHGQIYVALTTAPIEIRTKAASRKLFPVNPSDEDYDKVVAYGQITWKEAFSDGKLSRVEIPFNYHTNASNVRPTHLVIVCSASKFGDFYAGSASSVMYLDDFELVYE